MSVNIYRRVGHYHTGCILYSFSPRVLYALRKNESSGFKALKLFLKLFYFCFPYVTQVLDSPVSTKCAPSNC